MGKSISKEQILSIIKSYLHNVENKEDVEERFNRLAAHLYVEFKDEMDKEMVRMYETVRKRNE